MSKKQHGGTRKGAGRKPGPDWNGSGCYEKKVRLQVSLSPQNYAWLKEEAARCEASMSKLVDEAVTRLKSAWYDE